MANSATHDAWQAGENYETYMGRWSSLIAGKFIPWLDVSSGMNWLDVGCGTGALSRTILADTNPGSVVGVEPSEGFVAHARALTKDHRARFEVGNAEELPLEDQSLDIVTSALVLNFVPDKSRALQEMRRVTRPGGTVSLLHAGWIAANLRNRRAAGS